MPAENQLINYLKFKELDSTQSWAHANPDSWNPQGWTAITAGTQRQGRGSGGTAWYDVPGASLLMTLVSPPLSWSAPWVFVRHAQASLAIAEWLRAQGVSVRLKWPNDVYLNDRKLGGLLTEAYWNQARCTRWFLGLGLNVAAAPEGAAHLDGVQIEGMAEAVSAHLVSALNGPVEEDTLDRYAQNLLGWQRECGFIDAATGAAFRATPRVISPDGKLGIQLDSGALRWVGHKEVIWTDWGAENAVR
jgi:BirA family biotin operon repressor/biotin-[acetyl-CoA-carboxylase] ligase